MLPILFYNQLDRNSVQKSFDRVLEQLSIGDFKSADVQKMSTTGYYREILPPYRKQRPYGNSVLASHKVDKDSLYNKMLFKRVTRGCYIVSVTLIFEGVS